MLHLPPSIMRDPDAAGQREWLVTNGIGGYAMGAVSGARTRRYHGLLIAALRPPVGRWLMAAAFDDRLEIGGRQLALSGADFPRRGVLFRLEGSTPVWSLQTRGFHLEKRVYMARGANTTYIRYTLIRSDAPATLHGAVRTAYRDHHAALIRAADTGPLPTEAARHGLRVVLAPDAPLLLVAAIGADWTPANRWTRGELLAVERERGFDYVEDTLTVAECAARLEPGRSLTVVLSTEREPELDGVWAFNAHRERESALVARAGLSRAPVEIRQLVHAADQFIVRRRLDDGTDGHSVIAGYPWFGDWGRDTMIALSGLTLATRRYDLARGILKTFARYIDRGMLPNRFPDSGDAPEYNTADATLWYFEAVRAYFDATGDADTLRALFPALADIVAHHIAGTRYGIGVDPADGLLKAGEAGQNLTWMDAKVDGVVVTPRHGKPVEICALWINALAAMSRFAAVLGEQDSCAEPLARAQAGFARFWHAGAGYLYDVLDPADPTLRPNQLIAAMLPDVPLTRRQLRSIVEACRDALYTPFGMRTLTRGHPNYRGVFTGDWRARDTMYHQGPAWSWLLGPYVSTHLRAYGDRAAARKILDSALDGLYLGCVGSVSELFDGDAPHHPRAACAQAWGVAELLRVWRQIES